MNHYLKSIKNDLKILFDDSKVIITILIVFICTIFFISRVLFNILRYYGAGDYMSILITAMEQSMWYFVLLLIVSFYYMSCLGNYHIVEAIPKEKMYWYHFISLMIVHTGLTIGYLLINIVYGVIIKQVLWMQMFKNIFAGIFLTGIIAILIGWNFAYIKNRIVSISGIIVFIILCSPIIDIIGDMGMNLYRITDYFSILPKGMNARLNEYIGFPVQFNKLMLLGFWICMSVFFLMHHVTIHKKWFVKLVMGLFSIIFLLLFQLPYTKLYYSDDPNNSWMYAQDYYSDAVQLEEEVNFNIEKYDLDMRITNQLHTLAKLTLNQNNLDEYKFTMYHQYKIVKITNQDGIVLDYIQQGDYITVRNEEHLVINELYFQYKGTGIPFYADYEGIYLRAGLAYYPVPGFLKLYDMEIRKMQEVILDEPDFHIRVKANKQVYCNLPEIGYNEFMGKAQAVTLLSGMIEISEMAGVTFIYSPLMQYEQSHDEIQNQFVQEMLVMEENGKSDYSIIGKKVFMIARINGEPSNSFYDEHMLVEILYSKAVKEDYENYLNQKE